MYPSINPSIYLSIYLSIHLSIYPSIHLSIYPSIHLSIYLSISHIYKVNLYVLPGPLLGVGAPADAELAWPAVVVHALQVVEAEQLQLDKL